jgi:hypothetical protein
LTYGRLQRTGAIGGTAVTAVTIGPARPGQQKSPCQTKDRNRQLSRIHRLASANAALCLDASSIRGVRLTA